MSGVVRRWRCRPSGDLGDSADRGSLKIEFKNALRKGRADYETVTVDVSVLVEALDRVVAGGCVIDPAIVNRLLHRPRDPGPLDSLTPRETEVLTLMAEGRSNAAIATSLELGAKTLETHIRQILNKLALPESAQDHRRVLAVLTYPRSTS